MTKLSINSKKVLWGSQNPYYSLFSNNSASMLLIDPSTGKIVDANEAASKFYGYSLSKLTSMYIQNINTLSDKQVALEMARAKGMEQNFFLFEHRLANGTIKHVEVYSGKIGLKDKPFLLSIIHDCTIRKKAEEALKDSEENFRSIFENNSAAIIIIEPDTTITLVNNEYCRITGYSREEVIGRSWTNHITPEDIVRLKEYNRRRLLDPKDAPDRYEFTLYKKNGDIMSALMSVAVLRNKKILASFLDITESKKAELEIKENEKQLIQLNADKDLFMSILGHDLRSPFNSFLGLSELLVETISRNDFDKTIDIANNINTSAQKAFNLLEELLIWANTQQGKIQFIPQKLNLAGICDHIFTILKPTAKTKNIILNYIATNPIIIYADIDMLKTILRNLISNAIKFTNEGGIININAVELSGNITISVSDNGIGIEPENLCKLFDISQVYTTTGTAKELGTGLGLILCKNFIEKHGGKIWVESEVGKGSQFTFTFPVQ